MVVETTILRRPGERRIEYGFVDRCAAGGGDSYVGRICETSFTVSLLHCEATVFRQAEVRTYRPSTTGVTLEIEAWASDKHMMEDAEGAPIDVEVQSSRF